MISYLYFSICFFGWGVAIFLMTLVGRALSNTEVLVFNFFGYLSVNIFLFHRVKWDFTPYHALAIFVGVLFVVSNLAYYRLSQLGGQASVMGPLTGLYVLVPVLLGALFLHETVTLRKCLGVALALAAIFLLSSSDSSNAAGPSAPALIHPSAPHEGGFTAPEARN